MVELDRLLLCGLTQIKIDEIHTSNTVQMESVYFNFLKRNGLRDARKINKS